MNAPRSTQARIFLQLLKREFHVLKPRLSSKFIDGAVIVATQVLMFGYLMPLTGMPREMIAPTFIGTIIQLCFTIGYGLALRLIFDLENASFINYQITLPISKEWVFGVYLANFIIEVALTTLPLFSLGIIALGSNFATIETSIPLFAITYFLSLVMMGSLFLTFSFSYPFRWFFDNLWPRRLSPLFLLSSIFFPWKKVSAMSSLLAALFLCNPFTYMAEGLRSTLIGGPDFLSPMICIPMLLLSIGASWLFFKRGIAVRLDPV